jgi:hypothetical protein
MAGIIEHIQSAVGGETAKIAEFVHETFHDRMSSHGHFGRAAVETVAETCRKHPAAIGLAAGVLVDRLLVEEERRREAKAAEEAGTAAPADDRPAKQKAKRAPLRLNQMKPGRVAFEVFGGLMLLKIAASGARIFRHKHQDEVWFAPAAKIHLLSGTLCAYNLTKALRSKNVSAWRNGAILFFGTDAIKPVLKWYKAHPPAEKTQAPAAAQPVPTAAPAAAPAPEPVVVPIAPFSHDAAPAAPKAAPAVSYAEMFSHGAADFGPIRLEATPDPALALAQAFAGMMAPATTAPAGAPPHLQVVT